VNNVFGSIIHVGINFVTQNLGRVLDGLESLSQGFNAANHQATVFANGVDASINRVAKQGSKLKDALKFDWGKDFRHNSAMSGMATQIERDMEALEIVTKKFDKQWREIGNKWQSLVMGSVALSMSGIGVKNFGMDIAGFLGKSLDEATKYDLIMKQIGFYGKETIKNKEDELKLNQEIFALGRKLPVSTSEVATSMLTAMKTGYTDLNDAIAMGTEASKLQFVSLGKLKGEDSLKFANLARQLDGRSAQEMSGLTDMLLKTADLSALDPEGLFRAMMSTRSAKSNLKMDTASFLALVGGMGNVLNERGAGESLNVFSRGQLQAFGSESDTKRGGLWKMLGIDLEKEGDDMLKVIDKIVDRSYEIWGDTFTRREKLQDIFGNDALTLLSAYETNRKNSGLKLTDMRDQIKNSSGSGYSDEAIKAVTDSLYGLQEQLKSTKEQFYILFGKTMAPGFSLVLKQLTNFIGGVNTFLEAHPKLAAFAGYFLGITAAVSVAAGAILLFSGIVAGSISSIMAFGTNMIRAMKVADLLGDGITSVESLIRKKLISPLKTGAMMMGKMALASGLLYLAWKYDFLGLQSHMLRFQSNIKKVFNDAGVVVRKFRQGSVQDFADSFRTLGQFGGFWGKMSQKIIQFTVLMDGLFDAWNDDTISKDMYDKLKEAGVLKALGLILDVKHVLQDLWTGFRKGMETGMKILWPIVKPLWEFVKFAYNKIRGVLQYFGLINNMNNGISSGWKGVGETIGVIVGGLLAIKLGVKAWSLALWTPIKMFMRLIGLVGKTRNGMRNMGNWFKGGGPGTMAGRAAARTAKGGAGLFNWVFGNKQSRQALATAKTAYYNRKKYQHIDRLDPNNLPHDYATNRRKYFENDMYGGKYVVDRRGKGTVVKGRGLFGRLEDLLLGSQEYVKQTSKGRYQKVSTNAQGHRVHRFMSNAEVADWQKRNGRKGGIAGFMRGMSNFWRGWSDVSRRQGFSSTSRLKSMGGPGLGRGLLSLFGKGLGGMGSLGLTAGKGLLKGFGGILTKGIPFLFKSAFRLIPILGWALMAWDIISTVWTNWDAIKAAGSKAWAWIKTDGVKYFNEFCDWAVTTGIPAIINGTVELFKWIGDKLLEGLTWAWDQFKAKVSDSTWIPGWLKLMLGVKTDTPPPMSNPFPSRTPGGAKTDGVLSIPLDPSVPDAGPVQIIPSSHVGSKVTSEGAVNVAPGEVILRDKTVRDFESYVSSRKSAQATPAPAASGDTTITFAPGSVQITMANASASEVQKGARQLFEEFKRMVEMDNMRNYRSARAKG
jgi:TP901 family phage tail tape measure protein